LSCRTDSDPIREFLSDRIRQGWIPGAVWRVEGPGGVVSHGAVGQAATEPRVEPLFESTPYDLASLTKPLVTGLLLARLEQRGQLDLGAPTARHLDVLRGSGLADVSLATLAAHASGLPAWKPLYLHAGDPAGYLGQIATLPLQEPGRAVYSDLGYILLGAILERVSANTLDRLFHDEIAEPLGLERMGYAIDETRFPDAAPTERGNAYERGLAGEEGQAHHWRTHILRGEVHDANAHGLGGVAGHAGLFGTAGEVARLGRELLDSRVLGLDAQARGRLLEPLDGSATRTTGMVLAGASDAARGVLPDDAPGHTGFTGTSMWLNPAEGSVFVLLTNRVHPRVERRDFQDLRHGFHRIAVPMTRS